MISSAYRIFRKLRAMDRHEVADRCRQELSKRCDALRSRFQHDFTNNAFTSGEWRPGLFFFAPEQLGSLIELLRERFPLQVENILAKSERILEHRFDLLGFEDLRYGERINWHLDLVHSKEASAKPFHRVNYLNFAEVGDSKITWELNRHQHLVTLAKAYRLTGDERYAREIHSQWRDWHAANPYPIGINWASTLEVGFRSLSWMWVYYLLEGTGTLDSGFRHEWLRAQALNGRHLERYLSTYFSPNTHLLGEGVALFVLGTMCPELSGAARWKARGWQIVLEEARRQVAPDGMHFEKSTYYHVYALDFFLHAVVLASRNAQSIPPELEETLEKMLDVLSLLGSEGAPPRWGDDDGGRLFDPARNRAEHMLDPLAAGAILFNRADFKSLARGLREETIWLLGKAGVERWDRIEPKALVPASAALESSAIYVMTTKRGQLLMDCGCSSGQSHGHDHAGALSVCLQANQQALLIDPGTFEYVGPGPERNKFRGTAMHNTLRVDNQDQAEPDGPFSWKQHFQARAEQWITGVSFVFFAGSHNGYARLPSPVVHRRCIVALRSGIFLVRDIAEGSGQHRLDISWHLAADLSEPKGAEGKQVFCLPNSAKGLTILPAVGHGWTEQSSKGQWSPVYGRQSEAMILNFAASVTLPAEFVALLVPECESALTNAQSIPGKFVRAQHSNATAFVQAYRYETGEAEYQFFFGRADQTWQAGSVSSDAEFVCLSSGLGQHEPEIVFCNGTHVDIAGLQSVHTNRKVTRYERLLGPLRISCSDPDAIISTDRPSQPAYQNPAR